MHAEDKETVRHPATCGRGVDELLVGGRTAVTRTVSNTVMSSGTSVSNRAGGIPYHASSRWMGSDGSTVSKNVTRSCVRQRHVRFMQLYQEASSCKFAIVYGVHVVCA